MSEGVLEAVGRSVAALLMVGGVAAGVYRMCWLLLRRDPSVVRLTALPLLGCAAAIAAFHILSPLHLFTLSAALPLTLVSSLACALWPFPGGSLADAFAHDRRLASAILFRWRRSPDRWRAFAVLLFTLLVVSRCLVRPFVAWDTLTYHGLKAALWVQQGSFALFDAPGGWSAYRLYPANGEVLLAWAMLPFRSDVLAPTVEAVEWLALGIAVLAWSRELRLKEPAGSIVSVFVLSIPTIVQAPGTGYVDLLLTFIVVAAVLFLARALKSRQLVHVLLAAIGLGLAGGIKYSVIPLLVAATPFWVAAWMRCRGSWRARASVFGGALAAFALTWLPWMLHAYRETGYPLSPLDLQVGPVVIGQANETIRWYGEQLIQAPGWQSEFGVLAAVFSVPGTPNESLGFLVLLQLLMIPAGALALARSERWVLFLALAMIAANVAAYYADSFAVVRHIWSVSSSRFLLPAVCVGLPLSWAWPDRRRAAVSFALDLVFLVALLQLVRYTTLWMNTPEAMRLPMVLITLSGILGLVALSLRTGRWRPMAASILVTTVALAVLFLRSGPSRELLAPASMSLHRTPKFWANAAFLLDSSEKPLVIAATSGEWQQADNQFWYYFLGTRFQNEVRYVPPSRSGIIEPFGPGRALEDSADLGSWLQRLAAASITHVVSSYPRSIELTWMKALPDQFEYLDGDDDVWGVYRVRSNPQTR